MKKHILCTKFNSLLILLLCVTINGYAVNNYITLQVNTGLNFTCNTASSLETTQTITNAFTLHVLNNSNSAHVYVRISAWNYPAAWVPIASYPLSAIWASDTSPNATSIAGTTVVTTSDQLLFVQPTHSGATAYDFNYNLRLAAMGYTDYVPGNYNYTFTFTMTEP